MVLSSRTCFSAYKFMVSWCLSNQLKTEHTCVSYLSMTVHDSFSLSTHLMWNIVQSIHICVHEHEGTVRGQSAPFTQNVCNMLKIELHHSHLSHCFTDNSKESGPILLLCVHGSWSLWITNWHVACDVYCVMSVWSHTLTMESTHSVCTIKWEKLFVTAFLPQCSEIFWWCHVP